jgi:acyl carrier protein
MLTLNNFIDLLCDELALEKVEISPSSEFRGLRNWSSLNALLIMSKIHEENGVLISPLDLTKVKTVEEFFNLTQS